MEEKNDIHDFLISATRDMQNEYDRIMKRATEDPGTAGDQGEDPHHQPRSQKGKDRPCHHRLPAIDAECQAH